MSPLLLPSHLSFLEAHEPGATLTQSFLHLSTMETMEMTPILTEMHLAERALKYTAWAQTQALLTKNYGLGEMPSCVPWFLHL